MLIGELRKLTNGYSTLHIMIDLIISWGFLLSFGAYCDSFMGSEKWKMSTVRREWMDLWLVWIVTVPFVFHYFPSEYTGWEYIIRSGLTGFGCSVLWDCIFGYQNSGNIFAPAKFWLNLPIWKVKIVTEKQMMYLHAVRIIILILTLFIK